MGNPIELKAGDPCPACGGELRPARVPTDDQLAAATRREDPEQLPPFMDSAPKKVRDELGALHVCDRCRYKARFKTDDGRRYDERDDRREQERDRGRRENQPAPRVGDNRYDNMTGR